MWAAMIRRFTAYTVVTHTYSNAVNAAKCCKCIQLHWQKSTTGTFWKQTSFRVSAIFAAWMPKGSSTTQFRGPFSSEVSGWRVSHRLASKESDPACCNLHSDACLAQIVPCDAHSLSRPHTLQRTPIADWPREGTVSYQSSSSYNYYISRGRGGTRSYRSSLIISWELNGWKLVGKEGEAALIERARWGSPAAIDMNKSLFHPARITRPSHLLWGIVKCFHFFHHSAQMFSR